MVSLLFLSVSKRNLISKAIQMRFNLPTYAVSPFVKQMLYKSNIIAYNETPQKMLERVILNLFKAEEKFGTPQKEIQFLGETFASDVVSNYVMLGTPILTNAGRYPSALSSCAVIPVDLRQLEESAITIKSYYQQNMGSGFDFSKYKNPVELLKWLNALAAQETATGKYDRYIGNMGTLHISHPAILDFIKAKRTHQMRHFNISVDMTEAFMAAALSNQTYKLVDNQAIKASDLLDKIAENAWFNGDPGFIYMDRINKDNPIEQISRYVCTPPCGEMGLSEGETCQFGSINLAAFVDQAGNIDYDKLEKVVITLTRVLDNAIEMSLSNYPTEISAHMARLKRKIGIGVCGLADFLLKQSLPYNSNEGVNSAKEVLSFINFHSKCASVELGMVRGACIAMSNKTDNKYYSGFLEEKYASNPTQKVTSVMWEQLALQIRQTGILRNLLTTALPPTGRSSLLLGVTSSIEPFFSIFATDNPNQLNKSILEFLNKQFRDKNLVEMIKSEALLKGSFQNVSILNYFQKECLKTAIEVHPQEHILMMKTLASLTGVVDEAASKTINLPKNATIADVRSIFELSFTAGLKNISIYRDGSHLNQPAKL
jgi:ribonucleoside-diphosphate reductase alpha chain